MNVDALSLDIILGAGTVVLCFVLVVAWGLYRQRTARTLQLRQRFGSDYDAAVARHGSRRRAEADLEARLQSW